MLDEESSERDERLVTDELIKKELVEHPEVLEVVEERKKRKFTWSGLVAIGVGLVLIASGLVLRTGANSLEGLFVVVGGIVVLVGILRILIGLIRPIVPSQL
ncbi:MAG TPA: hypothetical protein VKB35_15935 [Ktedonobacteraceae bacterium]|nr:hypothetical protein [Ktedonobacteraceae bacterium]